MGIFSRYSYEKSFENLSHEMEHLIENKDYELAKAAAREMLRIAETIYPKQNLTLAKSQERLASLLTISGEYDEAMGFYDKALRNYKDSYDEEDPFCLNCLFDMANNHIGNYKYEEAEKIIKEIVEICERHYSKTNDIYLKYLLVLVQFHQNRGNHLEAINGYKKFLDIAEHNSIIEDNSLAHHYHALAWQYKYGDRMREAETYYRKSLTIIQNISNTDERLIFINIEALAEIELEFTNYNQAKILFEKMLEMAIKNFSDEHSRVAGVYFKLGIVYYKLGQKDLAEENWMKVVNITKSLGYRTDDTKNKAVIYIAELYRKAGDETKAQKFFDDNYVEPNVLY